MADSSGSWVSMVEISGSKEDMKKQLCGFLEQNALMEVDSYKKVLKQDIKGLEKVIKNREKYPCDPKYFVGCTLQRDFYVNDGLIDGALCKLNAISDSGEHGESKKNELRVINKLKMENDILKFRSVLAKQKETFKGPREWVYASKVTWMGDVERTKNVGLYKSNNFDDAK